MWSIPWRGGRVCLDRARSPILLYLCLILGALECGSSTGPSALQAPTLRHLAETRHFVIGTSVTPNALRTDSVYRMRLAAQYNGVTSEWAMKFGPIHPAPNQYDFAEADRLVTFAQANGMAVHGHTLLWGDALPNWITTGSFSRTQLLQVLQAHINTVVGRYRGRIATWDVVNEVVDGSAAPLRNTIWLQVIGPEYIDSAFVWTHRADPAARLYLNETHAEVVNARSNALLALVQGLRARGIPIDGVGFQAHFTLPAPDAAQLQANLARFAQAGFDVRVSEMDVRIADSAGSTALSQEAMAYRDMLDACLRVAPRCVGFTTWGFTDRYSWIPAAFPGYGRALPFDVDYEPKPAFAALIARLEQR
jgi:endo-1,4-beta-xylanase